MARTSLLLPLRAAINKARKLGRTVRTDNVRLGIEAAAGRVNLEVIPLKNLKEPCYLIFFEEAGKAEVGKQKTENKKQKAKDKDNASALRRRIGELERELAETHGYLQLVQEQHEAANEELQSSNEEATSANEELQSMNEELETSKEELESTNEELATVNDEMANRNQELNQLISDLNNLHASIQTPILVLGRNLTIRRFTPQAQKVFNLLATDVGRPLGGVKHNLDFAGLESFIAEVINSVSPREREVQDCQGNWYVLRVRPYLTVDNKIDGAVLMLMDINVLKQTEQQITSTRNFAEAVIEAVPPLLILESDLRVRTANEAFYKTFGVTAQKTEKRLVYELGNRQWNIPALRQLLEDVLPHNRSFHQYEVTHNFENLGQRTMLMSGRTVESMHAIVLSIEDITARKQAEEVTRQAKETLSRHAKDLEHEVQERTAKLQEAIGELLHFSYTITHDMRAPLRAMRGYGEMLLVEKDSLSESGQMYVARINNAAARMDELIIDALDYAKLSQHALEIRAVDVGALLRGMLASYPDYQPPVAHISIAENIPLLLANEAGLTQCFSNLLNNAIKFVQPGKTPEIRIWAEERDREPGKSQQAPVVRLWIEDNGIGIALEHQNKVFDMFQQLNRDIEGTGIGLALVRKATQRMNGLVGVESELGKGSRFWLEFKKA